MIRILQGQIHNPSNSWITCKIIEDDHKISISPIPPRSCRPLPPFFSNPKVIDEVIVPDTSIFASLPPNVGYSFDSFDISVHTLGMGSLVINGESITMSNNIFIINNYFYSAFSYNGVIYMIIIALSSINGTSFSKVYNSKGEFFDGINGDIAKNGNTFILRGQSDSVSIDFRFIPLDYQPNMENNSLSGNYLGYYVNGTTTIEESINFNVYSPGFFKGTGVENNSGITVAGYIEKQPKRFFFVVLKEGSYTIFEGEDCSLEGEVFFSGHWISEAGNGGMSFIKIMKPQQKKNT